VAVAGCSNAPAAPPAPSATPTQAPGKKVEQGVRGQITAETATSWTVTTAKGKAFMVTVSPQTVFGTKAAPATVAQFPVGTAVRVTGQRTGATVAATQVALAKAQAAPTATPAPAT
jgi:RNase P/RNase MRP subunit p29